MPVQYDRSQHSVPLATTTPARKRKRTADAEFEIADSDDDDEDFGWQVEDGDAMPSMPPQWQGSEDLILGTQRESDDDEGYEEESGPGPAEEDERIDVHHDYDPPSSTGPGVEDDA